MQVQRLIYLSDAGAHPAQNLRYCEEARCDLFDYIEMFYNPTRGHGYNNSMSPVEFEKQYFRRLESV
ncbi:TonB-dependent receptor [Novimethylophilus kurashikiensis]|uniref:TonB-dependent receptor n=1 Tax=Novimethylophilus kurashikiensis TaxID=1825523 RepID=A0A2R5F6C9_9PROT|nr:TonB-dependent receptor [Novimethylophilus kurashikiensis]